MKQTFNISAYSSKVFVISCCWRQTSKEKKSLSPGDTWFLIHSLKYKIIQSLTFIFLTFFLILFFVYNLEPEPFIGLTFLLSPTHKKI